MLGLELVENIFGATPSNGVKWKRPNLRWILTSEEDLQPGRTRSFLATLPILVFAPICGGGESDPLSSSQSSTVVLPCSAVFRAQSKAALFKCTVRLCNVCDTEGLHPQIETQQNVPKMYRLSARAESYADI